MENSPITGRKQYNNAENYRYGSPDSPQTPEAWRSPDSPPSPISPISPNSPDSPGMLGTLGLHQVCKGPPNHLDGLCRQRGCPSPR